MAQWKKEIPKATKRPFLCLLNNFEICSSYKSHACFFFLPTSDFIQQQQCDIMGLHSESSDSVPPLATCPARIPLCKHSRNTRGPAVREGKPLPLHLPSPVLFIQGRPSPMVWFVGWVFFSVSCDSRTPPPSFTGISYVSLRLNEGKQTYGGSWQQSVNGTCVSQRPRCMSNNICGLGLCNESILNPNRIY